MVKYTKATGQSPMKQKNHFMCDIKSKKTYKLFFPIVCVSMSGIPRKHARKLQRLYSLAFAFGAYHGDLRRPLYRQSRQSLSFSPTVWADFKALLVQKTKLPWLATVCLGKPDTLLP